MLARNVVESPDSAQPKPPHAVSCKRVPLMSWPVARKVSAPVAAAVPPSVVAGVPGEVAGVPGEVAGALVEVAEVAGAAAVLAVPGLLVAVGLAPCGVGPEQAVNSRARQASDAQAATCRGLDAFVVLMMSTLSMWFSGSASRSDLRRWPPRRGWNQVCAGLSPRTVRQILMAGPVTAVQGPGRPTRSTGLRPGRSA